MKSIKEKEDGFTIVELLVATAVLATILVMVTVLLTSIGNLYQKGINQAKVQDSVRRVTDDISQHLQLSSGTPLTDLSGNALNGAFCLGNTRYTYVIGKQLSGVTDGTHSRHVLWRDTIPSPAACFRTNLSQATPNNATQVGTDGLELIPPNSRLISFEISGTSPYVFKLGIAYGDNDLLCSPSDPDTCSSTINKPMLSPANPNPPYAYNNYESGSLRCKGNIGDQYCATAISETSIVQRLGN